MRNILFKWEKDFPIHSRMNFEKKLLTFESENENDNKRNNEPVRRQL